METGCSILIFQESSSKDRAGRKGKDRTHLLNVTSKVASELERFHG